MARRRERGGLPVGNNAYPPEAAFTALEWLNSASIKVKRQIWPVWFILFTVACWVVARDNKLVLKIMPNIPSVFGVVALNPKATPIFQMIPQTRHQSWLLGHIAGQAQSISTTAGAADSVAAQLQALCEQAAKLLGVNEEQVSLDLLQELGAHIHDYERPNGVLSRVKGLFKFGSLLWLVGVLGVTLSVGPAAVVLMGPIIEVLLVWAKTLMLYLHALARPFYYGAGLYGCLAIVSAAQLQPAPAASRLALAGVALATMLLARALPWSVRWGSLPMLLLYSLPFATLVPLAHAHQSQLLGFFAAASLFSALGFAAVPMGCGWLVGWAHKDQMLHTAIASAILVGGLMAARVSDSARAAQLLAPFQLGLCVFGTNCLLLAGLILSSRWYYGGMRFFIFNAGYALLLGAMTLAGALFGMDSVFAVGATYTALWLSDKSVSFAWKSGMAPVAVLMGSLAMMGGGYFIHTHPAWIGKMLS